jgi:arginine decarboxylase
MQINKAKTMFANAFKKHKYEGAYNYCYCTKSSHFSFHPVEETLKHDIHLETSYAYDIDIINSLYEKKKTHHKDTPYHLQRVYTAKTLHQPDC